MFTLSPAITLIWQIAATEAAYAKFEFIEREQIFVGLLKAGDILSPEIWRQMRLGATERDNLCWELACLNEVLSKPGVDRVKLRRCLRTMIGRGNFERKEGVVHRSETCKGLFARAMELVVKDNSQALMAIYLLQAILENPGHYIEQALKKLGIEPEVARNSILCTIAEKKSQPVGIRPHGETQQKEGMLEGNSRTYFLDRYGIDLTKLAREGKVEPLIGRRKELLQIIRTLSRKTKNNPLLIGEAGVGKTAIIRGLTQRIVSGNIVPALKNKRVVELNMGTLVAGTKYRGEFEERLVGILEEAKKHPELIIFVDEVHTLIGAGRAEGSPDAANIMKSALASGEISCIGATTLSEYQKYIEKDAALERRFQPITVDEPTPEETLEILAGLREGYESHHQVSISHPAIKSAVSLSHRYLPDRRFPDKALDLLDEACTRTKVEHLSFCGEIDNVQQEAGQVTEDTVAQVLAEWTTRLAPEEGMKLVDMDKIIKQRIIGQNEAVGKVSQAVKLARAGLKDPKRPVGVFIFIGPTGVGKTELAKATAEFLFGSEDNMIRLDMSEYMERHSVSKLIGAPPGYVGYEEEGQLTGRLRKYPYSIVLLDEIEKAHPDVFDLFLQVFGEGRLTDSKGRTVDAKNAIFIMTSNLGGEIYRKRKVGIGFDQKEAENQENEIISRLKKSFRPEFINRVDEIIFFHGLGMDELKKIALYMLDKLREKLEEQHMRLEVKENVLSVLCKEGYDPINGARPLARIIEQFITKPLSEKIIQGEFSKGDRILITAQDDNIQFEKGVT